MCSNYHKMREATMKWRPQSLLTLGMAGEYWRLRAQDGFRHCQCQQQPCARSLQSPALATQEGRKEGIVRRRKDDDGTRGFLVFCKIRAVDSIQMVAHINEYIHTKLTLYNLSISLTEFISAYRVATLPYPKEPPSVLHRPGRKIENTILIIQVMYVLIDQKRPAFQA